MAEPRVRLAYHHELGVLIEPPKPARRRGRPREKIQREIEALQARHPDEYERFVWWWNERRLAELKREVAAYHRSLQPTS